MSLMVQHAAITQAGPKARNDDAICLHLPTGYGRAGRTLIAAIADGVSVAKRGGEAASIAAHSFCNDFFAADPHWSMQTAGYRILDGLHRWLSGQNQHYLLEVHHQYLTTLSALLIQGQSAFVFHVGDSRIYRLRDGVLEQITADHVIRGMGENQLTRALGMEGRLDLDFRRLDAKIGDRFLLSTDGIHGVLSSKTIQQILSQAPSPQAAVDALLAQAIAKNSPDNQSCQVIDLQSLDPDFEDTQPDYTLPPLPDVLQTGQTIDGFTIIRELHVNARSTVYQASRPDGDMVVLKAPSPQLAQNTEALKSFMREDWIGQRIDHPDVVKTFAPPPKRQFLYLIQEYLSGCNLRVWRQQHPDAPVQTIIGFVRPAVRALRALHRRETLHQDVKPDNLILLEDGRVKLIDLGSARVGSINDERARPGAYEYAAPEYALSEPVDARADQFALAMTIYELLTGHFAYGAEYHHAQTPEEFKQFTYQPASLYNPHVPAWMDAALMRALSLNPEQRYGDLGEFMADLERPNLSLVRVRTPWIERSPVRFWQGLSILLLLGHLIWLMIWFSH